MKLLRLFRRYRRSVTHVLALYSTIGAIDSATGWHLAASLIKLVHAIGL